MIQSGQYSHRPTVRCNKSETGIQDSLAPTEKERSFATGGTRFIVVGMSVYAILLRITPGVYPYFMFALRPFLCLNSSMPPPSKQSLWSRRQHRLGKCWSCARKAIDGWRCRRHQRMNALRNRAAYRRAHGLDLAAPGRKYRATIVRQRREDLC